jgi:hypothetical protein
MNDLNSKVYVAPGDNWVATFPALIREGPQRGRGRPSPMWVAGEAIDFATYLSAIGVQRRVLISLGLERQAKTVDVPPM